MRPETDFDLAGKSFSTAIKICTIIGLILMIISGSLYFLGVNPFLHLEYVFNHWDKSSHDFWNELSSRNANPHDWFLLNISKTDSLSIIGIIILTISPLTALISILNKVNKIYLFMTIILIIQLVFSIFKPFI